MNVKIVQWLQENERDILPTLPSSKGATYNFGYVKRWIPSLSINTGGEIRINNNGATSYLIANNTVSTEWETYLFDCGGSTVNVNNGGKFIIGSDNSNKSGIVRIPKGSFLNLNVGGELFLRKSSIIIVENDGVFNLNGGTINVAGKSQIVVKSGGIL